MSNYQLVDDKDVPDDTIIPEDGWALQVGKVIVVINFMKFAEEENADGTKDCNVDYDIVNPNDITDADIPDDFDNIVGSQAMDMLEDAMAVRDAKRAMQEARENSE